MNPAAIVFLVLASVLGGVGLVAGIVALAMHLSARGSGWASLAQRFPAPATGSDGQRVAVMRVGPVMYRRCVRVALDDQGLTLRTRLPGHRPIRMPWSCVQALGEERLQWQRVVTVELVGDDQPRLTLPEQFRAELQTRLRADQPVTVELVGAS